MNHCLHTDTMRFSRFLTENRGWQQALEVQQHEIPEMQLLLDAAEKDGMLSPLEADTCRGHFREMLQHQQEEMAQVSRELEQQQQRLSADCAANAVYDTEAICYQDIIRSRIKELQKSFVDLKCNVMSFVSTVF